MNDIARLLSPRLYPIVDASFAPAWPASGAIHALAAAGCRLIQLRGKTLSSRVFYEWALEGVELARPLGVAVLINDRADIALAVGAAGVHLGQEDLSPAAARKILGEEALIGYSTHSVEQARQAKRLPVDYVAIGPAYATGTKTTGYRPLGVSGVARVRRIVSKPLVAIGGVTKSTGRALLEAGADALAVISALMETSDLETAALELMGEWR